MIIRDITDQRRILAQMDADRQQQGILNRLLGIGLGQGMLPAKLQRCLKEILHTGWMALNPSGGIFLVDDTARELVLTAHHNFASQVQEVCARLPFGSGLCGKAATTRDIQFAQCLDSRHEIRYPGHCRTWPLQRTTDVH